VEGGWGDGSNLLFYLLFIYFSSTSFLLIYIASLPFSKAYGGLLRSQFPPTGYCGLVRRGRLGGVVGASEIDKMCV